MPLPKDIIERANARLGSVLKGKWRLDAVIGIGGMASVYAATHRNQARAAIKLLHPEVALDAEVTARFLREGYVANAVGHPGTVTVLDDDVSEDNAPYLVMELLIGQTLDTMLALEPEGISVQEVLPLLDQLLDVLAAAHDKGIVHRDLKPENLFLTTDGRLKVLDFGIARLRELSSAQSPSATQAGTVLGTPAFMAPEQALGRWHEVDGRTDIWSVGATAFTLLSGHFVHEADTLQEQLVFSATRPARRLRELRPAVPVGLAHVIDRALSFDRADRFANARSMRGALRQATGLTFGEPLSPISPRIPASARVSTPADEHGATLVAPLEVTSAITGRSSSPTGRPVTRSTVISGRPARRQWPLVAAVVGLGLLGSAAVLSLSRRPLSIDPPPGSAALSPPSAPMPVPIPAPPKIVTSAPPAAVASAKHPPLPSPKRVDHLAPSLPTLPSLPALPRPATTTKSLSGDENPFDRRH
jgi:serine/threonine protein kinase